MNRTKEEKPRSRQTWPSYEDIVVRRLTLMTFGERLFIMPQYEARKELGVSPGAQSCWLKTRCILSKRSSAYRCRWGSNSGQTSAYRCRWGNLFEFFHRSFPGTPTH
jgi:hypothetical protein